MTSEAPHLVPGSPAADRPSRAVYDTGLAAEAFLSLGCMEGVYEPIVARTARDPKSRSPVYESGLRAGALHSLDCMEGVLDPIVERSILAEEASRKRALLFPGYVLAGGTAALAYLIHLAPVAPFSVASDVGVRHPVSAAIMAILLGLLIRNTLPVPDSIKAGCKSVVRKMIPYAIVLMGAGLNLVHLAGVGLRALLITMTCVVIAVAAGYYWGRLLGLRAKAALLLGAGTGICGNSAIVAVAPLIEAEDDDVVISIGTVNLFGLLAMLIWPIVGAWLSLGDERFGVWSGSSIHAVPQVVAAGYAYSTDAGALATLVKLVRVTMLAPLVFILAIMHARHRQTGSDTNRALTTHYARLIPWFVWGFVLLAILNTLGLIPVLNFRLSDLFSGTARHASVPVGAVLTAGGKLLLTFAMAAIGLEVNLRQLASVGGRAVAAGLASTVALGAASLVLVSVFL